MSLSKAQRQQLNMRERFSRIQEREGDIESKEISQIEDWAKVRTDAAGTEGQIGGLLGGAAGYAAGEFTTDVLMNAILAASTGGLSVPMMLLLKGGKTAVQYGVTNALTGAGAYYGTDMLTDSALKNTRALDPSKFKYHKGTAKDVKTQISDMLYANQIANLSNALQFKTAVVGGGSPAASAYSGDAIKEKALDKLFEGAGKGTAQEATQVALKDKLAKMTPKTAKAFIDKIQGTKTGEGILKNVVEKQGTLPLPMTGSQLTPSVRGPSSWDVSSVLGDKGLSSSMDLYNRSWGDLGWSGAKQGSSAILNLIKNMF
jgi:hypothetical protein